MAKISAGTYGPIHSVESFMHARDDHLCKSKVKVGIKRDLLAKTNKKYKLQSCLTYILELCTVKKSSKILHNVN